MLSQHLVERPGGGPGLSGDQRRKCLRSRSRGHRRVPEDVILHTQADAGSFILDGARQRWIIDLGSDDYDLPGYFDHGADNRSGPRWRYYRTQTAGHNTLVIDGRNQIPNARAPIIGNCVDGRLQMGSFRFVCGLRKAGGLDSAWSGPDRPAGGDPGRGSAPKSPARSCGPCIPAPSRFRWPAPSLGSARVTTGSCCASSSRRRHASRSASRRSRKSFRLPMFDSCTVARCPMASRPDHRIAAPRR